MRKFLSVLCIILSFILLVSCVKDPVGPEIPVVDETPDSGIDENIIIDYIVQNGASEYKVVYGKNASSAEIFAMGELVSFIGESTGVTLSAVTDDNVQYDENGKYISVGNTALLEAASLGIDYSKLNYDGFVIRTKGKNLFISGANDRGTIYAVYDFLEKVIGVRFIASDVTHVPQKAQVPLNRIDITEAPAFAYRNLFSYSMREDDLLYTRLRFNAPERNMWSDMYGGGTDWYTKFNVIHNAFYWVPLDYYDTHPEFFARDERGNTIRDAAGNICQLNLTNGITEDGELDNSMEISVAKVALESLKSFILDDPNARIFFFGHNDWPVYDLSPRSVRDAELYGGQSGILIRFVNVLSREIRKWLVENNIDRDVKIATWAYLHTKKAPVVPDGENKWKAVHPSVVPDEDVYIRIAPIELDWYYSVEDPNQIGEYQTLIREWASITDKLMIWTYETNFGNYLYYYPSMRKWSDNVKYFKKIGVEYLMMQDNYHGHGSWQADMHTYVAGKLLWKPELKVQPLIDEFLLYYFGEYGANRVKNMMDLFDDHFAMLQVTYDDFWVPFRDDDGSTLYNPDYFPITLLETAMSLVEDAIEYNKNDASIPQRERDNRDRRLVSALLTPQAMILKNYNAYYSSGRMDFASRFFKNAEYVGVTAISEVTLLVAYKSEFGLN